MTKFYVVNEKSEIWSEAFDTREEAEKELREDRDWKYGLEGKVIEVEEI